MFYGSDNFSVGVGLSIASPNHHTSRYMADQTFHTPNFGDEEFDIPPIALPQSADGSHGQGNMSYSMGMGHGGPDQQGHHYASVYLPDHMTTPMTMHSPVSYGGSPPTYTTLSSPHSTSQSPMGTPHMMHHSQAPRPQQSHMNAPPGRSPTNSNPSPANPETTTSDDSDDSVPVTQLTPALKRPSPEPVDSRSLSAATAAAKKPKAQKKKKKRDPNEPQKPVSAYALFFRDTQAAIKGQNPNASFGEVSKIVASMWDALDAEHKNVYKKKTEAAKKEYLKALAAYRASLVSKGASTDSADGGGMYPPSFSTSIPAQQHYTQHTQNQSYYGNQGGQGSNQQKKSQQQQQQQQPAQQSATGVQQGGMQPPPPQTQNHQGPQQSQASHQQSQQQQSHQGHGMMSQMTNSHLVDTNQYGQMRHNTGYMNPMGDGGHGMMGSGMHMQSPGGHGQMTGPGPVMSHMPPDSHNHNRGQLCVRNGCNNTAMTSPEWDEEYCSSECVVTHCRNVFTNWVSNNQGGNSNYGNSVKFNGPGNSGVVGADGLSYVT